jgi:hypothetical protein
MFFVAKFFADSNIKKSQIWLPNLKYEFKNKYPPLAKNFTKGYHSVTHVLYHFCDMSLITDCKFFCSLKFHVICTCTFFGDTICLPTNRKMIKIVTLIDSHMVLPYCWHCFLVSNISVSHALEKVINFYYSILQLFCFSFTQPFTYSKFSLPNPFLFWATPAINNDRSLNNILCVHILHTYFIHSNTLDR